MPFQPCPDIATTYIKGTVDSQLTLNTLNWFASGAITQLNLQTLVDAVADWANTTLSAMLSNDWSLTGVHGVDQSTETGFVADNGITAVGGVAGEANPNNVAAVVSLRTAQRGRSGHGRNFVPGIPGSLVTLNTLDPGFMDDLITGYGMLVGAGTFLTGWQLVVLSRRTGNDLRPEGLGIPVTAITMTSNKVRSMRSREVGHGA